MNVRSFHRMEVLRYWDYTDFDGAGSYDIIFIMTDSDGDQLWYYTSDGIDDDYGTL